MKTVSFVKAVLLSVVLLTGTMLPSTKIIDRDLNRWNLQELSRQELYIRSLPADAVSKEK